jgi:hypothetical protein
MEGCPDYVVDGVGGGLDFECGCVSERQTILRGQTISYVSCNIILADVHSLD